MRPKKKPSNKKNSHNLHNVTFSKTVGILTFLIIEYRFFCCLRVYLWIKQKIFPQNDKLVPKGKSSNNCNNPSDHLPNSLINQKNVKCFGNIILCGSIRLRLKITSWSSKILSLRQFMVFTLAELGDKPKRMFQCLLSEFLHWTFSE